MYDTTAAQVRTGQVISTAWSRGFTTLEVEYVTHERFTSPEGVIAHVVRFTGWELSNGQPIFNTDGERTHRVIRGWGQPADARIRVQDDMRYADRYDFLNAHLQTGTPADMNGLDHTPAFLTLSGRMDVAELEAELEEFLAGIGAAA